MEQHDCQSRSIWHLERDRELYDLYCFSCILIIIIIIITFTQADRLVKIWYQNRHPSIGSGTTAKDQAQDDSNKTDSYSFIYIAHPRAVTGFSWRKTSKYMPRYVLSKKSSNWKINSVIQLRITLGFCILIIFLL